MCEYCNAIYYIEVQQLTKPVLAPLTHTEELRQELINLTGINYLKIKANYCPMCRKEAMIVKVLKKGKYPEENIMICKKCGCEFQYYDTEIIIDMTTPDEESFLGGFGVHKYLKCPTCNVVCTISTDFIEHKSIFTGIEEWWKNLFYASTSKDDK